MEIGKITPVTPQVSIILEHWVMCEFCVSPCLIVKNFQCKIKGIFVIMENYKSLFIKVFNLGRKFNYVKGFLANVLVIITLIGLLHFSPKTL